MTAEDYQRLQQVSTPARADLANLSQRDLRERAQAFWRELGDRLGFRWRTARTGRGTIRNPRVFYAAVKEAE